MLLDLLKLFFEINTLQYFYIFLSLTGLLIIVSRKRKSLEDEITNYTGNRQFWSKHPEQTEKQSSRTRLYCLQMTLSILMTLIAVVGVLRHTLGDTGQILIQKYEDKQTYKSGRSSIINGVHPSGISTSELPKSQWEDSVRKLQLFKRRDVKDYMKEWVDSQKENK